MALNFPNSPTVGQIYTDTTSGFSYEWDGTVWKSYSPASASNIKILDDISGSFNGSTATFALTANGVSLTPANAQSLIITLGGVTQEPGTDYSVNTSNITFTTAPDAALSFSGISLGPAVPITYANDGNIYIRNTYTGAGTTGPFSFPEGYTVGYLDVYRNGVRLRSGTDFVGTSGTNFFLTDAAAVNDELEAIGYTITSIINASNNFDNINVTGITTTNHLKVTNNAVFSGIATHNANLLVGIGYSVGIGTNNPPYHLTVTEVGAGPTPALSYCIVDVSSNQNGYSQVNLRNINTGSNASGDLVITADNGTDTTNYIDLGINNSSFSNPTWTVNGALDGYLYSSNQNFSIGVAFTNRYLSFFAGGTLAENEKMRVNDTGVGIGTTAVTTALTVGGVVSATSFSGNGVNITGVATATSFKGSAQVGVATGGTYIGLSTQLNFVGSGIAVTHAYDATAGITTLTFTSTATGGGGGGGSGQFNTGISSNIGYNVTSTLASAKTLAATAGKTYIVQSILVSNVATSSTDARITGAFSFNGGEVSYFANKIPVPSRSSVELLKKPQVLNPSDQIQLQGFTDSEAPSNDLLNAFIVIEEKTDTTYKGVGVGTVGLAVTSVVGVFTSTTYPSVIESIRLANSSDLGDFDATVSWTTGAGTTQAYLVRNFIVPEYSSVELLDNPKRIDIGDKITVQCSVGSVINIQVSARNITP